jgi:hypothetical protein
MARPLSYQSEPWQIFEITTRCIHGRYLLTPGDESNRRVLGVLGRAQELFGEHVQVHMVAGTSNHLHILVTSRDAAWRARFKSHVKTNLSKELGDLHGWNEHVFGRRARDIPILDEAALLERVRYFLAHGVKEGLVEHPEDWPGPAWVRALTAGERLVGRWYRRSEFYHHVRNWMRRKHPTSAARPVLDEFGEDKELKLVPLPIWSHLTEGERATRFRAIIDGLVARPARNEDLEEVQVGVEPDTGRLPLGRDAILRQHPHEHPVRPKRTPAPWVHTTSVALRMAWMEGYRAFVSAWQTGMSRLRDGVLVSALPHGGVLCPPAMALLGRPPSSAEVVGTTAGAVVQPLGGLPRGQAAP